MKRVPLHDGSQVRRLDGDVLDVFDLGFDRNCAEMLLHHRVRLGRGAAVVDLNLRIWT